MRVLYLGTCCFEMESAPVFLPAAVPIVRANTPPQLLQLFWFSVFARPRADSSKLRKRSQPFMNPRHVESSIVFVCFAFFCFSSKEFAPSQRASFEAGFRVYGRSPPPPEYFTREELWHRVVAPATPPPIRAPAACNCLRMGISY